MSEGITTSFSVVVVVSLSLFDTVVVVVDPPGFVTVVVVVVEGSELLLSGSPVLLTVIDPSSNFTFEVMLTPFSALTVVPFQVTAYVPSAISAGSVNSSVTSVSPSDAFEAVFLAKRKLLPSLPFESSAS